MSKNPGGKKNPLLAADRSDRNRKIFIQVAVAAVLVALIAAIGIGVAVKKARKDDPGPTPSIAASANQNADGLTGTITDNGSIRIGKPGAKVTVRVVADLQCPACKGFESANSQVLDENVKNGTIAVEYNVIAFLDRMSSTRYSTRAANASYCVAEADPAKYMAWVTSMFAQQPPEGSAGLPNEKLVQIAKDAGYPDSVASCITDVKYDKYIQARTNDVLNSGIESTPSVFVNGKQIKSNQELMTPGGLAPAIAAAAAQ
ncbi:protein-disulfide isomerase [Nocardia tenerifensis]|uniref:Protein-disulfide isomerase n=1 Tax=Nocardia tenerifensis TaxID=228006 RepID=A0A318KQ74_9NOCA|nr:thioredoxin domain-containing protein [Nocardia tenerifensis]PXX65077.1 protein-disulfide isomerase [Nocardia tenerifensis]